MLIHFRFFTSEIKIPFESIKDVMRDDSWILVVQYGNEVNYQYHRDAGDADFIALWERIENEPEETIFSGVGEMMTMLAEGRNVMHVFRGMLQGWLRVNPFHQQRLYVFGKERSRYQTIIFTKNSPMTPVWKLGTDYFREVGTLGQIYQIWEGRPVENKQDVADKTVLTPGQVI